MFLVFCKLLIFVCAASPTQDAALNPSEIITKKAEATSKALTKRKLDAQKSLEQAADEQAASEPGAKQVEKLKESPSSNTAPFPYSLTEESRYIWKKDRIGVGYTRLYCKKVQLSSAKEANSSSEPKKQAPKPNFVYELVGKSKIDTGKDSKLSLRSKTHVGLKGELLAFEKSMDIYRQRSDKKKGNSAHQLSCRVNGLKAKVETERKGEKSSADFEFKKDSLVYSSHTFEHIAIMGWIAAGSESKNFHVFQPEEGTTNTASLKKVRQVVEGQRKLNVYDLKHPLFTGKLWLLEDGRLFRYQQGNLEISLVL